MPATVFNSGSGNWGDASTWEGGTVPAPFDDVILNYFDLSQPNETYQVDITGGEAIVDSLIMLDRNALSISSGALLTVGLLAIPENGALVGSGSVEAHVGIQNNGTLEPTELGVFALYGAGYLINRGIIQGNNGELDFGVLAGGLVNLGVVRMNGGVIDLPNVNNLGEIVASIDAINVIGDTSNSGTIEANGTGNIWMSGQTTNTQGAQLVADGGQLIFKNSSTGGLITISNGGSIELFSPTVQSTTPVSFEGDGGGILILFQSINYAGIIQDFGLSDMIDVDVVYEAGQNFFDSQSNVLTIGHGVDAVKIQFAGNYTSDDFVFRKDNWGGDTLISFNRQGSSAPETVDDLDLQLGSLYLGYFGRAGDPQGHAYWHDQLAAGIGSPSALGAIAASFAVQVEAKAAYPLLADPQHATPAGIASFIDQVYENLFGRAPDAAGAAYWQNQLAATVATAGVGSFVLNVISGAQAGDAQTIAHRAEVAAFFSDHLSLVQGDYDSAADLLARDVLGGVTSDEATVVAAKTAMSTFIDDQQLLQVTFTGIVTDP